MNHYYCYDRSSEKTNVFPDSLQNCFSLNTEYSSFYLLSPLFSFDMRLQTAGSFYGSTLFDPCSLAI